MQKISQKEFQKMLGKAAGQKTYVPGALKKTIKEMGLGGSFYKKGLEPKKVQQIFQKLEKSGAISGFRKQEAVRGISAWKRETKEQQVKDIKQAQQVKLQRLQAARVWQVRREQLDQEQKREEHPFKPYPPAPKQDTGPAPAPKTQTPPSALGAKDIPFD